MLRNNSRMPLHKQILLSLITLVMVQFLVSEASAQDVNVRILKVPGWERLLRGFHGAGFSAKTYGQEDRPAEDYQVVAIGPDVPSATAIKALRLIVSHASSIKYVILAGDHQSIATKPNEITVGATNRLMKEFPDSQGLDNHELIELIKKGLHRKDLFYSYVQATYQKRSTSQTASPAVNVQIREDGVLVYPNPDGSAELISPRGDHGFLSAEGFEAWPKANIKHEKPVREADVLNQEWLSEMNNWLTWIGDQQYQEIALLLGDSDSFNNYKAFENVNCDTLYEKIHMRRNYLTRLINKQNK